MCCSGGGSHAEEEGFGKAGDGLGGFFSQQQQAGPTHSTSCSQVAGVDQLTGLLQEVCQGLVATYDARMQVGRGRAKGIARCACWHVYTVLQAAALCRWLPPSPFAPAPTKQHLFCVHVRSHRSWTGGLAQSCCPGQGTLHGAALQRSPHCTTRNSTNLGSPQAQHSRPSSSHGKQGPPTNSRVAAVAQPPAITAAMQLLVPLLVQLHAGPVLRLGWQVAVLAVPWACMQQLWCLLLGALRVATMARVLPCTQQTQTGAREVEGREGPRQICQVLLAPLQGQGQEAWGVGGGLATAMVAEAQGRGGLQAAPQQGQPAQEPKQQEQRQ